MKGFNTSQDYEILWGLINQGYRVPAWVLYSKQFDIWDLVEVKMRNNQYMIGTRGKGYEGFEDGKEGFDMICKAIKLKFVKPNIN